MGQTGANHEAGGSHTQSHSPLGGVRRLAAAIAATVAIAVVPIGVGALAAPSVPVLAASLGGYVADGAGLPHRAAVDRLPPALQGGGVAGAPLLVQPATLVAETLAASAPPGGPVAGDGVAAWTPSGRLLWWYKAPVLAAPVADGPDVAVLVGSGAAETLVRIAADGRVVARDAFTADRVVRLASLPDALAALVRPAGAASQAACSVAVLSPRGAMRWQTKGLRAACSGLFGTADGRVLVQESGAAVAIAAASGKTVWRTGVAGEARMQGMFGGVAVLRTEGRAGRIMAVSLPTGRRLWTVPDPAPTEADLVVAQGVLLCPYEARACSLRDLRTGRVRTRLSLPQAVAGRVVIDPLAASRAYALFGVTAFGASPAAFVWTVSLGSGRTHRLEPVQHPVQAAYTYSLAGGGITVTPQGLRWRW